MACGYRGTDLRHVCDPAKRVVQPQQTITPPPQAISSLVRVEDVLAQLTPEDFAEMQETVNQRIRQFFGDRTNQADFDRVSDELAKFLGRRVCITLPANEPALRAARHVQVNQRCNACRSDITAIAPWEGDVLSQMASVAKVARRSYLQHRCTPLENSLLSFTYDELEDLHVELERDGTKMVERAAEIEKLKDARPR